MAKDIIYISPFLETFSLKYHAGFFFFFFFSDMGRREFRRGMTENRNVKSMYLNDNHIMCLLFHVFLVPLNIKLLHIFLKV